MGALDSQQYKAAAKNTGLHSDGPGSQYMLSPSLDEDVKPLTFSLRIKDSLSIKICLV